jgi:peptidoglycan hydrolase CwlO-like protein
MSPKASIKKFDKNMENNAKSKITKTGMNIEKTKKMIKDIRNEMVEFSSRFNER